MPRVGPERARLTSNDKTLYSFKKLTQADGNLDNSQVISASATLGDLLSDNIFPDKCIVSQYGLDKTCTFPVVESQSRFSKNSTISHFLCCTSKDSPNIWMYPESGAPLQVNNTEHYTVWETHINQTEQDEFLVLCSEETRHRLTLISGIGKIVVRPHTYLQISISKTNLEAIGETPYCYPSGYTVSVSWFPQPIPEHIPSTTDSTSNFNSVITESSAFDYDEKINHNISLPNIVSRHRSNASLHDDESTGIWISVLTISALALIASVATCLKCWFCRSTTRWQTNPWRLLLTPLMILPSSKQKHKVARGWNWWLLWQRKEKGW